MFKREYIFKRSIFHCHVSLPEGIYTYIYIFYMGFIHTIVIVIINIIIIIFICWDAPPPSTTGKSGFYKDLLPKMLSPPGGHCYWDGESIPSVYV